MTTGDVTSATTDADDQLYRDLDERQSAVLNALRDIEDIETDAEAGAWDDGEIANAANVAATELNALFDAIQQRLSRIPPTTP